LDDAPFGTDLLVDFVEFLKLGLFPGIIVELWVQEIDPFFSALDLGAMKSILPKYLGYLLPLFRGVEGITLCQ
jgi:hypothetical protein